MSERLLQNFMLFKYSDIMYGKVDIGFTRESRRIVEDSVLFTSNYIPKPQVLHYNSSSSSNNPK